jgi:hypothetical protein
LVSTSGGRTDQAVSVQFGVPWLMLTYIPGSAVHDCQYCANGWYTDPDSYMRRHYVYLDNLPAAAERRGL